MARGLIAAAVTLGIALTWTTWVPAGDAAESLTAGHEWGIAHAPGYVLYATALRATAALPWIDSVSAAKLLSGAATLAALLVLFAVLRRLRVSAWSAAAATIGICFASSVWYYSTYPKHNASTMLLVAAVMYTGVRASDGSRGWSCVTGILIGASIGLGWFAVAAVVPATLIWTGRGAGGARRIALTALAALSTAGAVWGLTRWRASASSEMSWGGATSIGRLWDLTTMADFAAPDAPGALMDARTGVPQFDVGGVVGEVVDYSRLLVMDLGWPFAIASLLGAFVAGVGRRWDLAPFASIAAVNMCAATVLVGVNLTPDSPLIQGGYLVPSILAAGLFAAVGIDGLAAAATSRFGGQSSSVVVAVAAVALLVGNVGGSWSAVQRSHGDLAETYAAALLAETPQNGVLIVWGAENSFAPRMRQVVHGERTDAIVVFADGLGRDWYREQLAEKGVPFDISDSDPSIESATCAFVNASRASGRPIVVDARVRSLVRGCTAAVANGLTSAIDSTGPSGPTEATVETAERRLRSFESAAGISSATNRWPNSSLGDAYLSATIAASNDAGRVGDTAAQIRLLKAALRYDDNPALRSAAATIEGQPR